MHGQVEREVRDDFPDQRLYSGVVRVRRYYPEQSGNIEGKFGNDAVGDRSVE